MHKNKYFFVILSCFMFLLFAQSVYAVGDGNMDSGGGDMADGTNQNKWTVGDEAVRVTVIRDYDYAIIGKTVDFTNK